MTNDNNYCLILAGGVGRRLWPCSRSNYPKQFIDFFGTGRTQLQQTYDRMVKIIPADHIFINTNSNYTDMSWSSCRRCRVCIHGRARQPQHGAENRMGQPPHLPH